MKRPGASAPTSDPLQYVHPDEARLAAWRRVYDNYLVVPDIYAGLADQLRARGVQRFAEIGGGRGPIAEELTPRGVPYGRSGATDGAAREPCWCVVVDLDEQMIAEATRPAVRGDLRALPIATASVDGVAAVNCLYFLTDPTEAIREAKRILRDGGVFVASCPSRWNDPELEGINPRWGEPSSFDAEDAPDLVASVFGDVEVAPWSVVAYALPDQSAIADYLHTFSVPDWEARAAEIEPPLSITKLGAEVWARA